MLVNPEATFDLAQRIRNGGAPLGEIFSFLSGLYFRGKLTYANHFARPHGGVPAVWIITSSDGLVPATRVVNAAELKSYGKVDIDPSEARYLRSLQASAGALAQKLSLDGELVLLGSVGTSKYVEPLIEIFSERLKFPVEFVGRGDMSRGGLLLRCAEADAELEYACLLGAVRHGKRPPKLEPKRRTTLS